MSGDSKYGPSGCEVVLNFDTCIDQAGGSLNPQGWTNCVQKQGNTAEYNKCVYDGYNSIVTCFTSFCNSDTSNTISTMKAAYQQYAGYLESDKQSAQQTVGQTAQQTTVAGQAAQQTAVAGQATQTPVGTAGATTNTINNADDNKSAATTSKVSKIVVGFLVVSSVLMNFL